MDDEIIHTLLTVPEVFAFKVPPRTTSRGYSAEDMKNNQIWSGKLQVQQSSKKGAFIRLVQTADNATFAIAPIKEGSVEKSVDSSRYYVIRIENAQGKAAFIGLGFKERGDAFDFNAALADAEKYKGFGSEDKGDDYDDDGDMEKAAKLKELQSMPIKDLSLKAGQTIKVSVKLANNKNANHHNDDGEDNDEISSNSVKSTTTTTKALETGLSGLSLKAPPPSTGSKKRGTRGTNINTI